MARAPGEATQASQVDLSTLVAAIQALIQTMGQGNKSLTNIASAFAVLPLPNAPHAGNFVNVNNGGTAYQFQTPAQVAADIGVHGVQGGNISFNTPTLSQTVSIVAPVPGLVVVNTNYGTAGTGGMASATAVLTMDSTGFGNNGDSSTGPMWFHSGTVSVTATTHSLVVGWASSPAGGIVFLRGTWLFIPTP